ncbi:lipopolysaccharide biosynthesis protein [Aminipila sp.]|uniref:lipopolysaccharide biosynthesis protein n=1 Tax=Aminipila sp. TaxID=2060095 RepID=UPI00289D82F0|nr:hypothetical protein [Aminipila sp.]
MERKDNKFLQASIILFGLNIMASALNYLCQLVMARVLSVESYGTINTIFSFMMIVAVPGATLTMVVAKYYAGDNHLCDKRLYLKKQLRVVLGLTAIAAIALLCTLKLFSRLLLINDHFVLIMAFFLAAFGYFQPLYSGVFSGNKCFILVGIYSMFIPLYKLLAVGGAYLYSKEDKIRLCVVLIILILGVIITALYGHFKSYNILGKDSVTQVYKERLYTREDLNALFLNISLMLYMNIDLLSVRYYGDETESGLYSSVLLFGRIIYYFATTLGTILLPSVADATMTEKERKKTLKKALILMISFAAISMVPINLFKDTFIKFLYGVGYLEADKYVIYVSIICLSLSIYTIMVNYVVGVGKTKNAAIIMLIVDILLLGSVAVLHSVTHILLAIGIIGIIGAIAIYLGEKMVGNNKKI